MEGIVVLPQSLPLGFRFRPTDEELVNHYLKHKINGRCNSDVVVIAEVDVCKCEPWDLPDKSLIRSEDPEWFFFGPKDRKYPNGHRKNRATEAGYWKATGRDRTVRTRPPSAISIGMKKTLVFHRGRAPKGERTNWIMHEYRTVEPEFEQGGFVLYRLFRKPEEKISVVNAEEIEFSDFSPALTKSPNDITSQREDCFEEFSATLNQEIVVSTLDRVPKAMENSNESDCDGSITPYTVVRDSDIGNMKVDPSDDALNNLSPGFWQGDSDGFHCNSPTDYYLSYLSFDDTGGGMPLKVDDGDGESISEFLDAILFSSDEGVTACNPRILANSTEVPLDAELYDINHESPLEYISGTDLITGNNVEIEDLLLQQEPGLDSSCKFQDLTHPSSFCLQSLPHSYNNTGAQFGDYLMANVDFSHSHDLMGFGLSTHDSFQGNGMFESSEESNNLFGVHSNFETSHKDLFVNETSVGSVNNSTETGIKLMVPKMARHTHNQGNISHAEPRAMAAPTQGVAIRRIRLQKSIHAGSITSKHDKSSNIEESCNGKSDITEVGQNGELCDDEQISFSIRAVNVVPFGSSDDDDTASSVEVKQPSSCNSEASNASLGLTIKGTNNPPINPACLPLQKAPSAAFVDFGRVTLVVSSLLLVLCIGIAWISKYLTSKNDIYNSL
ncbi:hypothetical protein HPP92_020337 [Vanilla planifolia]|uniref:NAC domain-containing protein n=1 Tax=Vanilla planifolia TaxID=51239 RepID=A0A835UJP2_VANPL|nr:hypothetical protein HPP92_020337 [Vanilla planifolia]